MEARAIANASRILGRLWLEELREPDLERVRGLPQFAQVLGDSSTSSERLLVDLAVEYQRLFGFNLPPYESVFLDPSAMLMAPATSRVRRLYDEAGWSAPRDARIGADDHLGCELLAWADLLEAGHDGLAGRLLREHLALWIPVFVEALRELKPHPFYESLGALSLGLVLSALEDSAYSSSATSEDPEAEPTDWLPELPSAPRYSATEIEDTDLVSPGIDGAMPQEDGPAAPHEPSHRMFMPNEPDSNANGKRAMEAGSEVGDGDDGKAAGLRDVVQGLLTPREAGFFLSRRDIGVLARAAELPRVSGERKRMLAALFRSAGEFEALDALLPSLDERLASAGRSYADWAEAWPAWAPVAHSWQRRIQSTRQTIGEGWMAESQAESTILS